MTVRIKAPHKLRGLSKYFARGSHETVNGKMTDTYYYDVPEERVEEAKTLGGELCRNK